MMLCWFPVLLFVAVGLAETAGYWTLHNFQLLCDHDGITCVYNFAISEDAGTESDPANGSQCLFTIDDKDGKPANQTDFQNISCLGNSQYKINGGWSPDGFVTIVVTNTDEDVYAFFAYSAANLGSVGTFSANENAVVPQKRSAVEWQILNLQQDYDDIAGNAELTFVIREVQGPMSPCTIITKASKGKGRAVGSFYGQKCLETDRYVSWDYAPDTDSATMTLVEPESMLKAVFEWESVAFAHGLGNSLATLAAPCAGELA